MSAAGKGKCRKTSNIRKTLTRNRLGLASACRRTFVALNQRIFDTSLDLILICDKRGTLTRISPSAKAILGYDPTEMSGHSAREFLYPEDLDNTREEMRRARRGGEIRNFECRYVNRDGHVVPLRVDRRLVRAGATSFFHRPRRY